MGSRSVLADLRAAAEQVRKHFRLQPRRAPRTTAASPAAHPAGTRMDCSLRPEWLDPELPFPLPDWSQIATWISSYPAADHHELWCGVTRRWALSIAKAFGGGCNVFETANILAVLPGDLGRGRRAVKHYDEVLATLRSTLQGMLRNEYLGKCTLFVAPDQETYYRYLSLYTAPGEHIQSGGVHLDRGNSHLVLPAPEAMFDTRVVAHEMCHDLLGHLRLPLWLNEGVTQLAEAAIAGRPFVEGHSKTFSEHRAFWTPANIGLFWSGKGFDTPGETSALSYDLAYLVVQAFLALDRPRMAAVVRQATPGDAGFAAFSEVYGQTPATLLTELFGPGDWTTGYAGRSESPAGQSHTGATNPRTHSPRRH